ncbi:MAG: hypothetical protein Q4P15_07805 [Propionibacteriaceae bacterium]|nr:hypothetical protein [Propionibacteriaceae bacterium]
MTMIGLMIMIVFMTMFFSAMADGRQRRGRKSGHHPGLPVPPTPLGGPQHVAAPLPYGFTRTAWGLPTDVPLSRASSEAIESDITSFGIELRELDFDVVGYELTDDARGDYTTALDAYEKAKVSLRGARADSEATHITHILEEGRYAVARVRARALGKPLPMKRPPCFFDPAHGPSVQDVDWAPPGGAVRAVPACAVDAARIGLGADPQIRMVNAGQAAIPYWEDRNHAAWARGYYGPWMQDPSMRRMTQGTLMIGGFSQLMGLMDDGTRP